MNDPKETRRSRLFILRQKTVWLIAAACTMMYVTRYAISSWAVLFLQEERATAG